jgi:hypothetical protein
MNDFEAKRTLDASKGRKAAVLVMDSQAQKESAIGLLYGCSRVVLRHGADDTRVKPVEVLTGTPDVALSRYQNSHDEKGVQWEGPMEAL